MGAVDDPCNLRPDNTTDSTVDVCNRFSSLPIEDPQVMASSAEELPETERSQGGSDHSSDKLELVSEMMMHRSSSQEFNLAISGNKFQKQQEKNQGERCTSTEVHSNNSGGNSLMSNGSSGAKPQTHNQEVEQQQTQSQQSTAQKSRPPNAATSTTKPGDQYTTMTGSRQQQTITPSQQPAKESERAETGQKLYPNDYSSRMSPQLHQSTRDKDIVGRDTGEAWFHYAPNPNRIKQLPPRFQCMVQEQLANQQQQQQQQQQHSQSTRYVQYCTWLLSL